MPGDWADEIAATLYGRVITSANTRDPDVGCIAAALRAAYERGRSEEREACLRDINAASHEINMNHAVAACRLQLRATAAIRARGTR